MVWSGRLHGIRLPDLSDHPCRYVKAWVPRRSHGARYTGKRRDIRRALIGIGFTPTRRIRARSLSRRMLARSLSSRYSAGRSGPGHEFFGWRRLKLRMLCPDNL